MRKHIYNIFAKFKYKGKEYFIILINNKKILFCCLDNANIRIELTDEEKQIMNTVYKAISVDKKSSIYMGIQKIEGKSYKIFYDAKSKNYFWEALNKNDEISEQEHTKLNFRFNHVPIIVNDIYDSIEDTEQSETEQQQHNNNNNKTKNKKFINKLLKIGRDIIIILVISAMPLSITYGAEQIPAQIKEDVMDVFKIENYDFEEFKTAIKENPNLTDSEKDFLYKFKFVFDENHEYMNLELVKHRLESLSFEYVDEKNEVDENIKAQYNKLYNKITAYGVTCFEDLDKRYATHEIGHVFQEPLYNFLSELSNEVFTRETLRRMYHKGIIEESEMFKSDIDTYTEFGAGYSEQIYLFNIMASMISQEDLKKFQFEPNSLTLILALNKIKGVEFKEASETIHSFTGILYEDEDGKTYMDDQAFEECYNHLNKCFKKANGIDIEEDFGMVMLYKDAGEPADLFESKTYISEAKKHILSEILAENTDVDEVIWKAFEPEVEVLPQTYFGVGQSVVTVHSRDTSFGITDDINKKYQKYMKKLKKELEVEDSKSNDIEID